MPVMHIVPWILTAVVASVACMVSAAIEQMVLLSLAGALTFALALVATSAAVNAVWWNGAALADGPETSTTAAVSNAGLMALGYLWGGLSMLAIYRLTGLHWQHGWQYGLGMLLIAILLLGFAWLMHVRAGPLGRPGAIRVATQLTGAQAIAAAAGLGFLIGSGKLFSVKSDWAANHIFLSGGLALVALSAIAIYSQARLARQRDAPVLAPVDSGQTLN